MKHYFIRQSDIILKIMLLTITLIITSCAGVKTIDEDDIITPYTTDIDNEKGVVVFSSRSTFTQSYVGQPYRSTPDPCNTIIFFKNTENDHEFTMKGEYDTLAIYPIEPGEYAIFQVNYFDILDYRFSIKPRRITYIGTFITDNWRHTNLAPGASDKWGARSIECLDEFSEAKKYIERINILEGWNLQNESRTFEKSSN